MLRCTWGAGARAWGWGWGRGRGAHGLCSGPGPPPPPPWRCLGRAAAGAGPESGLPLDAGVPRDVELYRYERQRTFFSLGCFCLVQGAFWAYLAYMAFDSMPEPEPEPEAQQHQQEQHQQEQHQQEQHQQQEEGRRHPTFPLLVGIKDVSSFHKWRLGFTGSCLAAGIIVVGSAYLFARRSVSRILLHRGGQAVSMTTYYPFGFTSTFTVPLHQISGSAHRSQARAMIPIKVKNKLFYYLVDKQGQFSDATLFDLTVGASRKL